MKFEYEELPSGITAVFGHRPHYETSSARLVFKAGNLHEDPAAPPGVAHFLEHTPFQGTEQLPTMENVWGYADEDGTYINAATGSTTTAYIADGVDLYRTMNIVFQLGFHPLLTEDGLENDRNAVVEEAREEQFNAYRPEIEEYYTQFGGPLYSRLIQGNIQDVQRIHQPDIKNFYRAHYQPGNAFLVVCSSLSVAKQRKIANELASRVDPEATEINPTPKRLNLPWLTPERPVSAFHNKVDDEEAQSGVSIGYNVEVPRTFKEYVLLETAVGLIDKALFAQIRKKLNLAYAASAGLSAVENTDHGASEDYYAVEAHTNLAGVSVVSALDSIRYVEESVATDCKHASAAILAKVLKIKEAIQAKPCDVADNICESAQVYYDERYAPREELAIVQDLSAEDVMLKAASVVADRRLIGIAGPDIAQLAKAEKHASEMV